MQNLSIFVSLLPYFCVFKFQPYTVYWTCSSGRPLLGRSHSVYYRVLQDTSAWPKRCHHLLAIRYILQIVSTTLLVFAWVLPLPSLGRLSPPPSRPSASIAFGSLASSSASRPSSWHNFSPMNLRTPELSPKETYALFNMRSDGLEKWHVPKIFIVLLFFLQSALVLFLGGIIDLLVIW